MNAMKETHDTAVSHAAGSLADTDPAVSEALENEARRQRTHIKLVASENVMSRAVGEALGWAPRRIHPVPLGRVRETSSIRSVPRSAGEHSLECPRREGGMPRRGASPRVQRLRTARR